MQGLSFLRLGNGHLHLWDVITMDKPVCKKSPANPLDLTLCKSCADVFFNSKRYYIVLAMTDMEQRSLCDICQQRKGRDLLLYERKERGGTANE